MDETLHFEQCTPLAGPHRRRGGEGGHFLDDRGPFVDRGENRVSLGGREEGEGAPVPLRTRGEEDVCGSGLLAGTMCVLCDENIGSNMKPDSPTGLC